MCASASSGCSVLGIVGDSEEELWIETASLRLPQPWPHLSPQGRSAILPLALLVPLCLDHGQRQRGSQVSGLAEASNSHALKGLVSVEGQGQIQGHQGLAALSTRHRSTPGAVLQRFNLAHCAVHVRLALVDSVSLPWARAVVEESRTSWLLPIRYQARAAA